MSVSSVSSTSGVNATDFSASFKQTRADFQSLASALQSGDLSSAQQAFAQLQQDNPRLAQALNSDSSTSDNSRLNDLKSLAGALQSGNLAGAQQAFAQLQPGAQSAHGHHHHHHHAAPASPDTSTDGSNGDSTTGSLIDASA
jgi:hypothetical protein